MSQNTKNLEVDDPYGQVLSLADLHAAEVKIRKNVAKEEHDSAKADAMEQFGLIESKGKKKPEPEPEPEVPTPEPELQQPVAPETPNPFAG